MLTFHNKPELKRMLLDRLARHEEADTLRQGCLYWGERGGCALGCSLYDPGEPRKRSQSPDWHGEMARVFGIPADLARVEEILFEWLAAREARAWPRRFIEAMPVGVDPSGLAERWANLPRPWTGWPGCTALSERLLKELRATAPTAHADGVGAGAR